MVELMEINIVGEFSFFLDKLIILKNFISKNAQRPNKSDSLYV